MNNTLSRIICAHYKLPPRIEKLSAFAHLDLYYGPLHGCDRCGADTTAECTCVDVYTSFSEACDEITAWASENLSEVWIDTACDYVGDSEPEAYKCPDCPDTTCETCNDTGWIEPYTDDTYHLTVSEVKACLFGKELASYV